MEEPKEALQGVFHRWIWQKLYTRCKETNAIDTTLQRKDVSIILCNSHVPKALHQNFLKEMEKYKLIKLKNKQKVKVIDRSWFG